MISILADEFKGEYWGTGVVALHVSTAVGLDAVCCTAGRGDER
jgi:hypothetical protein